MTSPASQTVLCPYCGSTQPEGDRCAQCGGRFDVLSRQATQNAMGPWFIRDQQQPFRPGCSYDTLRRMVQRARIDADTIIRGPTTHQFWMRACEVPGLAHLLGRCHSCGQVVAPADVCCEYCGAPFSSVNVREVLGLLPPRDVQTMAMPGANATANSSASPVDPALASVGYERLQQALARAATNRSDPTAADLAAAIAVADDETQTLAGTIRPPRQKRNVREYVDPEDLAREQQLQREQRMRFMKGAISILTILVFAVILVGLLWYVGVFNQFLNKGASGESQQGSPGDTTSATGANTPPPAVGQNQSPAGEDTAADNSAAPVPIKTIDDYLADYEQAILAVNSESIDELQSARAAILAVMKNVPEERRPPDIDENLRRIERQIDKIKLRELIDGGG